MEKILLIAGCSHAAGSEIDGSEDSADNRRLSFGGQLAIKLGYRPINIACPGYTNASIARSIIKWFEANWTPDAPIEVAVLVAWTESNRIEVPLDDYDSGSTGGLANWFDVTARHFFNIILGYKGETKKEKELCKYFHRFIVENPSYMEIQTITNILLIQNFLKLNKIKYLMCNTMQVYTSNNKHVGYYMNMIDKTKYMGVHSLPNEVFYWKYRNLGYENVNPQFWHLGEEPHHLFAQDLYTFNEENKCL